MKEKICLFGIYDPKYSRNRVLINGFIDNEYEVVECRVDPRSKRGIKKFFALYKEYKKIRNINFKYVIVGFPGHSIVWLARILFGKNIIFDAFVSMYNSNVEDRMVYSKYSIFAFRDWILDWTSIRLAKKVLLDTNAHIKYFVDRFGKDKSHFVRIFIGVDGEYMFPNNNTTPSTDFIAHFHGTFIPLQGIEYIVKAFDIIYNKRGIRDIKVRIVGGGQESKNIKNLADKLNVLHKIDFIDKVPYEKVPEYIRNSSVNLGIFGSSKKTDMVIPNKVYEAIGCGKVVLTSDTEAIREVFTHKKNIILVPPHNEIALANALIDLKNSQKDFEKINSEVLKVREALLPKPLVRSLIESLR